MCKRLDYSDRIWKPYTFFQSGGQFSCSYFSMIIGPQCLVSRLGFFFYSAHTEQSRQRGIIEVSMKEKWYCCHFLITCMTVLGFQMISLASSGTYHKYSAKKNFWIPASPLGKQLAHFACLSQIFFRGWVVRTLVHLTRRLKLLAQHENPLVPD